MLQYGANLLDGDAGKPFNELRYECAVFEVLEERCDRHPSSSKHPGATHALRIALDGRACGPINHDVNDTTRAQTTKTANAAIDRPETAARSAAVEGPCRIACWARARKEHGWERSLRYGP